jgi:hypothetical protein
MRSHQRISAAWILAGALALQAQQTAVKHPDPLPPIPMPQDRAADSYSIYSLLMPVGEIGGANWPHGLWLLANITVTFAQPDQPCIPQGTDEQPMNPHVAVHPPPDKEQDYAEMLADFDRHCHDRILLSADPFHLPVPVHVLTEAEQSEFRTIRFTGLGSVDPSVAAKYNGAPGLTSFSEVYFNAHHTVGMVYGLGWCGAMCGQGGWEVLGLEDGQWKALGWDAANFMI